MNENTPETLITSGYRARREGRLKDARRLFLEAVGLSNGPADQAVLAKSLTGLGQIERDLENNAEALRHYRKAAEIYRSLPDPLRLAHTIRHVGDILRGDGSIEEARPCYQEALKVYRENSETSPLDLANAIRGFALLRTAAGEKEPAKSLWQEARSLYESEDIQAGVQESDAQLARL
jgi:tetratricopeptide (TPR) repeat protein